TMADMNISANDTPTKQAPAVAPQTRTDDQNFPSSKWVPIGKSNCVLNVQKSQRNPIFPIVVAILKNTNFFRAFTTSSTILAIYIHQFWATIDALDITPTNDNNPYVAPPSSDTVIEYRAILSMINMCLTGKTDGYDMQDILCFRFFGVSSIAPTLTMLKEFGKSLFNPYKPFSLRKNLTTTSCGKKKTVHLLIPSVRFTKLIIHHLKTKHNIHPRTGSSLHYSYEEHVLNTLRFIGKDGREIFGMQIPDALLTNEVKGAPYYGEYQEHIAKYQQYLDAEHGKAKEGGATESPKATKVTKPKAAKATKPAGDKAPKPAPTQPSKAVPEKSKNWLWKLLMNPHRRKDQKVD
nr:hypothetical protein [Tanacetum cinerariifolium]